MRSDATPLDIAALDDGELIGRYAVAERGVQHLRANFVSSLDGAATVSGRSGPLGSVADQRVMAVLRMLADVVLVGAGTVRVEGYGTLGQAPAARDWRHAHSLPAHPVFATVSGRLDLNPASKMFAEAPVRPIVFTHDGAPPDRRAALADVADVVSCGEAAVDPQIMLAELARRGLNQVLCEGGPHLFGTLVDADLVDELCLSLSPTLVNGPSLRITAGQAEATRSLRLAHVLTADDMLLLRYLRR